MMTLKRLKISPQAIQKTFAGNAKRIWVLSGDAVLNAWTPNVSCALEISSNSSGKKAQALFKYAPHLAVSDS